MNYRAIYSDGFDKTISAQDVREAQEKAEEARPVRLFTIQPKVTNRDCLRLLDGVEQRFRETLESSIEGEERIAALRLLLREVHILRNDYWVDAVRLGEPRAIDEATLLSNKIFEAF